MKKIDCLGEICPIPVINLKNNVKKIKKGEPVMIVTDHSCSLKSISDFCQVNQLQCEPDEVMTGVWEITITSK